MPTSPDDLNSLVTKVTILERDSELQTRILEKLDVTVGRTQALVEAMSTKTAIHDEKFKNQDRENNIIHDMIDDRRSEAHLVQANIVESINDLKKDLMDRIDRVAATKTNGNGHHQRSEVLKTLMENWKWLVFGVAFGAGIFAHKWGLVQAIFGISN